VTVRYLLDTNVASEPLKKYPNKSIIVALERHESEIAISSTVWHELNFEALRLQPGRNRDRYLRYFEEVVRRKLPIVPYDEVASFIHAQERARLVSLGRTPSFADGQIAATAIANDLVLVTSNVVHFEVFEGLAVEDWRGHPSSRAKKHKR
jgi:tRNA(fMet)-specific endonuclease VapC